MARSWRRLDPTELVYSTVFYHRFSTLSSLSSFLFFSFSAYRSFCLRHSFLPTFIIYFFTTVLSLHLTTQRSDYPSHASVPSSTYASHSQVAWTDESVFLESLFGDILGAFAWSMVIDWSFFLFFLNMVR